eukprot:8198457-Karenia_brevis.AAC.1
MPKNVKVIRYMKARQVITNSLNSNISPPPDRILKFLARQLQKEIIGIEDLDSQSQTLAMQ